MSDDLKPALSAEEWAKPGNEYGQRMFDIGDNYVVLTPDDILVNSDGSASYPECQAVGRENIPPMIALLNYALPDDSPYKITRADVKELREIGEAYAAEHFSGHIENGESILRTVQKLAALLPPETP